QALRHRSGPVGAGPLQRRRAEAVPGDHRLPQLHTDRVPDLAVRVHLLADQIEGDVAVVQRTLAEVVVPDADLGVPGDVTTGDDERVTARLEAVLVQVLHRELVRSGLVHRAGLLPAPALVRAGDGPAGDRVRVLVSDHRLVEVAVHARGVEAARDRLP